MAYAVSRSITIDHTLCGASDSTNFPVLFYGVYTYLKTFANGGLIQNVVTSGGEVIPADLVFTSDSGGTTPLPFEVEFYDPVTGTIAVWIQIPTLSHTVDTVFYFFYGDSGVTTFQGNINGTWNSNFKAVWHFADGTTLSLLDSTSNANNYASNTLVVAASGQIDGSVKGGTLNHFPSSVTPFNAGTGASLEFQTPFTLSCWVNQVSQNGATLMSKADDITAHGYEFELDGTGHPRYAYHNVNGTQGFYTASVGAVGIGAWHHVAMVWAGGNVRFYVDGALTDTIATNVGAIVYSSDHWLLGFQVQGAEMIGSIDEVHAAAADLGTDWITAEFNNQNSPSTFYSVSGAITPGITLSPAAGSITYTPATPTVTLTGNTVDLAPAAGAITYTPATPLVTLSNVIECIPAPAQIRYTPASPFVSLVQTSGSGLTIGGNAYNWLSNTAQITKTLSAPTSAVFQILYGAGGASTMPQPGQEVAFFVSGTKRFGGLVLTVQEDAIPGDFTRSIVTVTCTGYQSYADRVVVAKLYTLGIGGVTGIIAYDIWLNHLAQFGVTHGPGDSPPNGIGEILFHYISATECFNQLKAQAPGWDWTIDDNKVFDFLPTSAGAGPAAPFTLRDTDSNVDTMSVISDNSKFRNKQWVLPSIDIVGLWTDTATGDGSTTAFVTEYALNSKPIVTVGGVVQIVGAFGSLPVGWQVYYIPGGVGVFFATAPGSSVAIGIAYPAPFPLAFSAEDDASIAAVGLYETVTQATDVLDADTAQDEAAGLLELYGTTAGEFPQEIDFTYNSHNQPAWLVPGMTVDVARTFPTATGLYTVESVTSLEQDLTVWRHTVVMRAGLGAVTDAQAIQEFRTSSRNPITGLPSRLQALIGQDIGGLTNPGLSIGLMPAIYVVPPLPGGGVLTIASWDGIMGTAPSGADLQADWILNGASIFPSGGANKMVIPDGSTALITGINFTAPNLTVKEGDKILLQIIQVGSSFGGSNGTFHLNFKR